MESKCTASGSRRRISEILQVRTTDFHKVLQVGCWCSEGYIEDLKQFNHIQYRVSNTNTTTIHDMPVQVEFLQEQIPPLLPSNIYTIGC